MFSGVDLTMSMTQNSQRPVAMISAFGFLGLVTNFTLFSSSESSL